MAAPSVAEGREDNIIADNAIMTDMTVIHEISAPRRPRVTAPPLTVPTFMVVPFADGAAFADLKPGRLIAIARILRRSSKRGKRINHAAGGNPGMAGNVHMRDQPAVSADHDIAPDHAEGGRYEVPLPITAPSSIRAVGVDFAHQAGPV